MVGQKQTTLTSSTLLPGTRRDWNVVECSHTKPVVPVRGGVRWIQRYDACRSYVPATFMTHCGSTVVVKNFFCFRHRRSLNSGNHTTHPVQNKSQWANSIVPNLPRWADNRDGAASKDVHPPHRPRVPADLEESRPAGYAHKHQLTDQITDASSMEYRIRERWNNSSYGLWVCHPLDDRNPIHDRDRCEFLRWLRIPKLSLVETPGSSWIPVVNARGCKASMNSPGVDTSRAI